MAADLQGFLAGLSVGYNLNKVTKGALKIMRTYRSKYGLLPGSTYDEVVAAARKEFNIVRRLTKRQPYVKSRYFKGDKVFITIFWDHLMQKHPKERRKRLKLYKVALDLIRNTTLHPERSIADKTQPGNTIYSRFYGVTKTGDYFCVQIKVNVQTGRKDFMSVFARKPK